MSHRFTFRQSFKSLDEQDLQMSTAQLLTEMETAYSLNDTDVVDVSGSVIASCPVLTAGKWVNLHGDGPDFNILDIAGETIDFEFVKALAFHNLTIHEVKLHIYYWQPHLVDPNIHWPWSQYLYIPPGETYMLAHSGAGWPVPGAGSDDTFRLYEDPFVPSGERIETFVAIAVAGKRR